MSSSFPALHYNGFAMNVEAVRTAWIGRLVDGRFPLREFLGGSDASAVFLTELPGDGPQKAAIKIVPAEGDEADKRLGAWALARAFSHPNLMRVIHSGSCILEGTRSVYVVTECADEVLSEIIPARPLSPDETRQMLAPVLDVLGWLHGSGFVHGHIKPSNIFVVGDEIKLSADGLLAAGATRPSSGPLTIYDAPEIRTSPLAPAVDVWSLGITLVETLTQQQPSWDRTTNTEPVVPAALPQPFADIARGCLRPIPTYRMPLSEAVNRLEASCTPKVDEPKPREPVPEPATPEPLRAHTRTFEPEEERKRVGVIPIVAVLTVVLVIIAVFYFRGSGKSTPTSAQAPPAATSAPKAQPDAPPPQADAKPSPQTAAPATTHPAPAQPSEPLAGSGPAGSGPAGSVTQRVMPQVLASAQSTIHGTVKLAVRVTVDPSGKVTDASLASPGPSRYFDRVALEASRNWQFSPPRSAGQPAPSTWVLHYQFRRDSIDCTPQQVAP